MATEYVLDICSSTNALSCPVCLSQFKDPVIIQCHHSFCRKCLSAWIAHHSDGGMFNCPFCKRENHIPSNGVSGFEKSFHVEQMRDILLKQRVHPTYPACKVHETEDLKFFCTDCKTTICRDCKILRHEGHWANTVADASEEMRYDLKQRLKDIRYEEMRIKDSITTLKNEMHSYEQIKNAGIFELRTHAEQIIDMVKQILTQHEKEICSYIQPFEQFTKKDLSAAESKLASLVKLEKSIISLIEDGKDHDVINKFSSFVQKQTRILIADDLFLNKRYKKQIKYVYYKGSVSYPQLEIMMGSVLARLNSNSFFGRFITQNMYSRTEVTTDVSSDDEIWPTPKSIKERTRERENKGDKTGCHPYASRPRPAHRFSDRQQGRKDRKTTSDTKPLNNE